MLPLPYILLLYLILYTAVGTLWTGRGVYGRERKKLLDKLSVAQTEILVELTGQSRDSLPYSFTYRGGRYGPEYVTVTGGREVIKVDRPREPAEVYADFEKQKGRALGPAVWASAFWPFWAAMHAYRLGTRGFIWILTVKPPKSEFEVGLQASELDRRIRELEAQNVDLGAPKDS